MSTIIIRLQNLPLSAKAADIREFFGDLKIPKGSVNIVGGPQGDAFIGFSTDEDARLAMLLDGRLVHNVKVHLMLSSRREMDQVIANAQALAGKPQVPLIADKKSTHNLLPKQVEPLTLTLKTEPNDEAVFEPPQIAFPSFGSSISCGANPPPQQQQPLFPPNPAAVQQNAPPSVAASYSGESWKNLSRRASPAQQQVQSASPTTAAPASVPPQSAAAVPNGQSTAQNQNQHQQQQSQSIASSAPAAAAAYSLPTPAAQQQHQQQPSQQQNAAHMQPPPVFPGPAGPSSAAPPQQSASQLQQQQFGHFAPPQPQHQYQQQSAQPQQQAQPNSAATGYVQQQHTYGQLAPPPQSMQMQPMPHALPNGPPSSLGFRSQFAPSSAFITANSVAPQPPNHHHHHSSSSSSSMAPPPAEQFFAAPPLNQQRFMPPPMATQQQAQCHNYQQHQHGQFFGGPPAGRTMPPAQHQQQQQYGPPMMQGGAGGAQGQQFKAPMGPPTATGLSPQHQPQNPFAVGRRTPNNNSNSSLHHFGGQQQNFHHPQQQQQFGGQGPPVPLMNPAGGGGGGGYRATFGGGGMPPATGAVQQRQGGGGGGFQQHNNYHQQRQGGYGQPQQQQHNQNNHFGGGGGARGGHRDGGMKRKRSRSRSPIGGPNRRFGGGGGGGGHFQHGSSESVKERICVQLSNVPYKATFSHLRDYLCSMNAQSVKVSRVYQPDRNYSDRWIVEFDNEQDARAVIKYKGDILNRTIRTERIQPRRADEQYAVMGPDEKGANGGGGGGRAHDRDEPRRDGERRRDRTGTGANAIPVGRHKEAPNGTLSSAPHQPPTSLLAASNGSLDMGTRTTTGGGVGGGLVIEDEEGNDNEVNKSPPRHRQPLANGIAPNAAAAFPLRQSASNTAVSLFSAICLNPIADQPPLDLLEPEENSPLLATSSAAKLIGSLHNIVVSPERRSFDSVPKREFSPQEVELRPHLLFLDIYKADPNCRACIRLENVPKMVFAEQLCEFLGVKIVSPCVNIARMQNGVLYINLETEMAASKAAMRDGKFLVGYQIGITQLRKSEMADAIRQNMIIIREMYRLTVVAKGFPLLVQPSDVVELFGRFNLHRDGVEKCAVKSTDKVSTFLLNFSNGQDCKEAVFALNGLQLPSGERIQVFQPEGLA